MDKFKVTRTPHKIYVILIIVNELLYTRIRRLARWMGRQAIRLEDLEDYLLYKSKKRGK